MYKRILSQKIPVLNEQDEIEVKEFKFFFGIHVLYPLKHEYKLDIPDFEKFSKKSKESKSFSFDQIEFMMKFLHSAHLAYCDQKGIDPQLSYHQVFMAFDGEYQAEFAEFMGKGMDVLMDSLSEENPKKPGLPKK